MKKLFIIAVAAAAVCLASCGGKTARTTDPDSLDVNVLVEAASPVDAANQVVALLKDQLKKANLEQIKAIAASVTQKVAEFVANGDNEAVQSYTAIINNFVAENAERLQSIGASTALSEALTTVQGLPANIVEATSQAAEGVKTEALTSAINALASGENVLEAVQSAAGNALSTAIGAAVGTATDAQDAAAAKAAEVKDAAAAAKAAVEAAPAAAKEAVKQKAQEATDAATQKATDAANKAIDDAAAAAKKKLGI